jgi:hypothetical protein
MAKATTAKSSNVRNFDNAAAIADAVAIQALTQFIDKASLESSSKKTSLVNAISIDCTSSMIEDGVVYGNYQIPVRHPDDKGNLVDTGDIVEVVLSCASDALTVQDQQDLAPIGAVQFAKLFEEEVTPVKVDDPKALLTFLATQPNLTRVFVAKSGKISLSLAFEQGIPGVSTEAGVYPRTGFFVKLQEVITSLVGDDIAIKALAEWMAKHVKAAVKTGNRVKETT